MWQALFRPPALRRHERNFRVHPTLPVDGFAPPRSAVGSVSNRPRALSNAASRCALRQANLRPCPNRIDGSEEFTRFAI